MQPSSGQPSLYALLRDERLLAYPPAWTSRHLDMVGCRFQDTSTSPPVSDPDERIESQILSGSSYRAKSLAIASSPLSKICHLSNLLSHEGSSFQSYRHYYDWRNARIPFWFDRKAIDKPQCVIYKRRRQATQPKYCAAEPLIGFTTYSDIKSARQRFYDAPSHPGGGCNAPGGSLCRIKLRKITPEDWTSDPYFVCILLSLMQLHRQLLKDPHVTTFTSRLLVANDLEPEFIHLYEARVSSIFLEMLDRPNTTMSMAWPIIQRKRIPFKPYDTFRHRLVAELLEPSTPYDCDSLREQGAVITKTVKRQHDAKSDHERMVKQKLGDCSILTAQS
ncbi:hypothetical protein BJX70DRAFT_367892 [Aspergillus crustosus]